MSKFLVTVQKQYNTNETISDQSNVLIGKQVIDTISIDLSKQSFMTIKKINAFEKIPIIINFDSCGGTTVEPIEYIVRKKYRVLPDPPYKAQHIFLGWFTASSGGTQVTINTIVSDKVTTLYAQWEEVQIASDCTSYSVTTTSSYKNTGIYVASISNSSQPIYIDWGDGAVEKINSSISQKSHTYKTVGNFTVKISNNITSFAPSYDDLTWCETTSQNRYTFKGMLTTGSKVTSLPENAFYYCQVMTDIDFMQTCWPTVTSIPYSCFYYCTGLTSIQGAKRFTDLGSRCFQDCSGLTGIQDLSEFKFTMLPNLYTFARCTNVTQWILPSGFNGTSFGSYMFSTNTKLSVLTLPNSLTSIGAYTFQNCSNLKNVIIPSPTTNVINAVQIEYLETTGSQCIDTELDIKSTDNLRVVFDFSFITRKTNGKNQYFFSTTSLWLSFEVDINSPYHAYANVGSTTLIPWTRTTIPYDQWIHCDYNINAQNKTISITGWQNINSSYAGSHGIGTFYICSCNNSNYADIGVIAKFKPMQIYINDTLVRDFIPVRVENIGYMYDKVSKKLFGNSGIGNFILGPDKEDVEEIIIEQKNGLTTINQYAFYNCNKLVDLDLPDTVKTIGNYAFYGCTSLNYAGRMSNDLPYDTEIEYLESTGTQYIDTEIIPSSGYKVLIEFLNPNYSSNSDKSESVFGQRTSSTSTDAFSLFVNPAGIYPQYANDQKQVLNVGTNTNVKYIFEQSENGTYLNNELIKNPNAYQFQGLYSIYLFAKNQANDNGKDRPFTGQIFSFKLWNVNDILVRDFIPVRIGNTGYMYDKVSGQLFGNSGIGSFILGPDIKTKELPSQLTSIGANAYRGCSNLKSLNIPENLQTIGDYAFAGCYQISSIVDKRLTAQTVSTNTFGNTTGTGINAYTGYNTKGNNVLLTYFAATGYDENIWDDPLQKLDKCGFVQQYIDPENVVYHTVTFDAGNGSITETSKQITKNRKIGELPEPICPEDMPYFGGWYTEPNGEGDRITKDYKVTSDITLYALYSDTSFTRYEVILNDQWQASTIANPDSSQFDGVYESFSNYNVGNKSAVMYIKIIGYTSFTIYIRSYAESSFDYTVAFNLDTYTPSKPLTSNPSSSTFGVKVHTSSKQNSGTTIGSYTKVEYTGIDGGEYYICIAYRKDGSVNSGTDRGYVLIKKT